MSSFSKASFSVSLSLSPQAMPVFIFANQAGLDMLETTLVSLQDITLDKIFDDPGLKALFSGFSKIMQQVIWAWGNAITF